MECVFGDAGENDLQKNESIELVGNGDGDGNGILTTLACASRKSPLSIARIMSHRAINIARCDFICPSSNSNVTSLNVLRLMHFSRFFLTN